MPISNNEIKHIRSLASKKFRDMYGEFVAEGEKMVSEAVASSFAVENIWRRDEIGEEAMSRISQLSSPSPVLAVVRKPENVSLETGRQISGALMTAAKPKDKDIRNADEDSGSVHDSSVSGRRLSGLYLALDSMRDPGNLGTVLRIADWFGINAVFASPDTVDVFNPKVVQATMGAIFRVRFHYTDIPSLAKTVLDAGGKVYGTFLDGRNIYNADLDCGSTSPVLIVIGNESEGISAEVARLVSDRLFIPPYPSDDPGSESLNAAVATAITVSEFRRRSQGTHHCF